LSQILNLPTARGDADGALEEEEDYSHGAHNFFDSQHVEEEGSRRSGAFGVSIQVGRAGRWAGREGGRAGG
jgi:hypothetical protein